MLPNELFEETPDPVFTLVNISAETKHITGGVTAKVQWWLEQAPKHFYIGRGSIFGNPYSHLTVSAAEFQVKTRDEAIEMYRAYLLKRPDLLAQLKTLEGKRIGCWCIPKHRCHGEVLMELLHLILCGKL